MSELPPNIDAILASIRSRMNEDGVMPPPELPRYPTPPAMPPLPVADIGQVVLPAAPGDAEIGLEPHAAAIADPQPAAIADPQPEAEAWPDAAAVPASIARAPATAAVPGVVTIDALVRAMLEPMLKAWLDANMPEIVEKMAQAEIKRLTGKD